MKKAKVHIHPLLARIVRLEAYLKIAENRLVAHQFVLARLLANLPEDEALLFLSVNANNLQGNPDNAEHVALLDELREDVSIWRELRAAD